MNARGRSWVGLIAFCFTSTLAVAVALAMVLASATLTFAGDESSGNSPKGVENSEGSGQTYSGIIADSFCGARHNRHSNLSSAECTRACVKKGAKYVMVDGEKTYLLEGNIADLSGFAGQRVEVRGMRDGDTIRFTQIGFLTAEQ